MLLKHKIFTIHDPDTTDAAQIQESKLFMYAPADIDKMVLKCTHLTNNQMLPAFARLFHRGEV
jgi:hypothetical protein